MNGRWVEKNIEAVRHLRSTYRLAREDKRHRGKHIAAIVFLAAKAKRGYVFKGCPLCAANMLKGRRRVESVFLVCSKCPWVVFNGKSCLEAGFRKDSADKRIERLNAWEKRLLEMRKEFQDEL